MLFRIPMDTKFEVVISGISGRFPECSDVTTFRKKLYTLDNFITVDDRKWPVGYKYEFGQIPIPDRTGKCIETRAYDFRSFKLNALSARSNDLINRNVLEPSFEAIIDAGYNPYVLDGENIGVFMSCGFSENDANYAVNDSNYLFVLGGSRTMQANRISFSFNFKGPSYTFYSDPLGSVQALFTAYKYISDGTIDAAVVGVSSCLVDPKFSLQYVALSHLSPDGQCRTFDESASGYGRSESTIVFFLQKAEDAKRNYGTIIFSDTFYLGSKSTTLLGIDEDTLTVSLKQIYEQYNVTEMISQLAFLELSACGLKDLEKLETDAIVNIVSKYLKKPLLVGSIKSNIGHTQAAAAFASIVKALFALDSGLIAPNANFSSLNNKLLAFKENHLQIVTKTALLENNLVAVNAIGLDGTLSHIMLKQNPKIKENNKIKNCPLQRILLISGRTQDGLIKKIEEIGRLPFNHFFVALTNEAFGSYIASHVYRGYIILPKTVTLKFDVKERGDIMRPIWFLFSGMGSQWNGMGQELLQIPVFADVIKKCDLILKPKGIDIYNILTSEDNTLFDNIVYSFVGIIAMQLALFEVLKQIGITPDGIIGHSVGENACAYADGCLTLEQAVLASYERGIASIETQTIKGMMAAIGKGYKDIKDSLPADITVACHNSADSCTLSGPAEIVNNFVTQLKKKGIFAKSVNVANIAYHSKHIAPAAPQLMSNLKKIIPNPKQRSSKWISTSIPEAQWNEPLARHCSAEYLTNNLLNAVLFEEGMKHVPSNAVVIEIAPHGLLQAILNRSLPDTCANIALTSRNKMKANIRFLFSAIGQIYMAGCEPHVNALFPPVSYPVPRNTPSISPYCTWDYRDTDFNSPIIKPSPDRPLSAISIPIKVNADAEQGYLQFHKIKEDIIIPPSFFMHLAWKLISIKKNASLGDFPVLFENIKLHKNVLISIKKPRYVSIMIQERGDFEIILENENKPDKIVVIMSGSLHILNKESNFKIETKSNKNTSNMKFKIQKAQFYQHFKDIGFQLSECFTSLNELFFNDNDYYSEITWSDNWVTFFDALMKVSLYSKIRQRACLLYPRYVRKLIVDCPKFTSIKKGSVMSCYWNSVTNVLQCDGLEMCGIDFSSYSRQKGIHNLNKLKLQGYQFVSYANPRMQTAQQFLELCLEIALEILENTAAKKSFKLNIIEDVSIFTEDLKLIIKKNKYLKANVILTKVAETWPVKKGPSNTYQLLITTNLKNKNHNTLDIYFILTVLPSFCINDDILENFILISKQIFHDNTICLFRKKSCLKMNNSQDTGEHATSLNGASDKIFEVKHSIEQSDLKLILSKKNRDCHKRYLYLMDDNNVTLQEEESLFKSQMILDLPMMLCKDGEWGTYKPIPNKTEEHDDAIKSYLTTDIQLESVNTFFYCTDDEIIKTSIEQTLQDFSYGIEYSGMDSKGTNIMGLALIHSNEPISKVDPFLIWDIPKGWNLEDATTVPHIYAQVYYIIMYTNMRKFSLTSLINMGDKVLFAECCINLFLYHNCTVFVNVSNEREADYTRKRFPQLNKNHILLVDKCQYEDQIKYLTGGMGVDIVVNCLPGLKHVMGSLNCLGNFSYYIETVESNLKDSYELGMKPFLKFVSFKVILNKMSTILKLSSDEKRAIQKYMSEGIKRGIVKPFQYVTCKNNFPEHVSLGLNSYKKVIKCIPEYRAVTNPKLRYDDSHSYIIIVGERKENSWLELIEWLIRKGARQFIVVFDNIPSGMKINHQINRLMNQNKTFISMTTSCKISTVQDAVDLIKDANKIASLEAVYFISMDASSQKIRNLNEASQLCNSPAHFVSLFSGGLTELESRRNKNLPATVIHHECYPIKLSNLLSDIDQCIAHRLQNNAPTLYKIVSETSMLEKKDITSILFSYLPKDQRTWSRIGSELTASVIFEERTSLSPKYTDVKGVYPVFVIPSIHYLLMDDLLRKLFYPVFCATLSEIPYSVPEMATVLFQELNKIQSRGPITVISEAWNAAVAIALGSLIAKSERKFRIFLIDGNPAAWKECTKFVCNDGFRSLQNLILKTKVNDQSENDLQDTNKNFKKALNALKTRLFAISEYELSDGIIENVTLFEPYFSCDSSPEFSVTSNIFVMNKNLESSSWYEQVSRTINNDAIFSWRC